MLEPSGLYYSNRIARFFFRAMEVVLGRGGLEVLLSTSELDRYLAELPPDNLARQFDFADMAAVNEALEDAYGERGGRSMALRIGRAWIEAGLNSFGAMAGMQHPAFQNLPVEERARIGLQALADIFTRFSDQQTTLESDETYHWMFVDASPMAWGRNSETPVCHAITGLCQQTLNWATGGYEFHVQEVECESRGDERCVFRVNQTAIGKVG